MSVYRTIGPLVAFTVTIFFAALFVVVAFKLLKVHIIRCSGISLCVCCFYCYISFDALAYIFVFVAFTVTFHLMHWHLSVCLLLLLLHFI